MKKIALLCLALVLALGSLGTAYALWYEDLYIDGMVYTGTLDVQWSIEDYYDDETKDFSSVVAYMGMNDELWIDVYNAYPCVTYTVIFDVDNIGTIPVHLCPLVCSGIGGDFPGTIVITNPDPFQIHPGDTAYGTVTIHLDNTAVEGATYHFRCLLKAVQYNEPCPTPVP